MRTPSVLVPLAAGLVGLCLLGTLAVLRLTAREAALESRLAQVAPRQARAAQAGLAGLAGWLGAMVLRSGLLPGGTTAALQQTMLLAGYRPGAALPTFVGAKILLLLAMPLLGWTLAQAAGLGGVWRNLLIAGAGCLGMVAPDMLVRRGRRRYLAGLERGLPDALDLMVICAEAGLPLEAGIDRVARELRAAHPPVGHEFELLASELRILSERRLALVNLGRRIGTDSVTQLAGTLAQALQYGTPLTQALRTLSAEMRERQLVRFEERAARLPVLLTLPMVLFILPCVFLIVGGPAIIQVIRAVTAP